MRWIAGTRLLNIRPYSADDREALFRIAADTAFFGEPIEFYLEDRRVFLDGFYAYYTDYEAQHIWVGCDGDQVVGFLTGCLDSLKKEQIVREKINRQLYWRLLRGYYHLGRHGRRYLWRVWLDMRDKKQPVVDLSQYPAHLHVNVDKNWRGFGIGSRLIKIFLEYLNVQHVPGIHLSTTSENTAACRLYEKMGFELLFEYPLRHFEGLVNHPIHKRSYGLKIADQATN